MAYLYVKSGGTATGSGGSYGTQKTGSWSSAFSDPSQYYGRLLDTHTALAAGDIIFVSNAHNYYLESTSNIDLYRSTTVTHARISVISVDDSNIVEAEAGAKESYVNTGTTTIAVRFNYTYVYGLTLEVNGTYNLYLGYLSEHKFLEYDTCTFIAPGHTSQQRYIYLSIGTTNYLTRDQNNHLQLRKCVFKLDTTSRTYNRKLNTVKGTFQFIGCRFESFESSSTANSVFTGIYTTDIHFLGCDFSLCNRKIISTAFRSNMIFERCLESSNTRYIYNTEASSPSTLIGKSGYFLSGSSLEESNSKLFSLRAGFGEIQGTTSVYRNSGATFDGVTPYSIKLESLVSCNPNVWSYFKLIDVYVPGSYAITVTVELAQDNAATALTTEDIHIDLIYPNSANSQFHRNSTKVAYNLSPSNLATSSVTWTGLTNPTKQYISVTTTSSRAPGICSLYVFFKKASSIVYFCPKLTITS